MNASEVTELIAHCDVRVAEAVTLRILRDAARSNHHRHVVLRFSGQTARDAIVILIRSFFASGYFAHDSSNAVLTSVVRCGCEVPRSERSDRYDNAASVALSG